jgi:S-adenosylmethionine hydrolase
MSIILFTDFGSSDLYIGQVKAVLQREAPELAVIDLLHDVADYDIEAGAHLLAALSSSFPPGGVFLAVIDPGVGGPRAAVVLLADDRWYVGPDNGLLSIAAQRAREARVWRIAWRPERLSASFHGRDLFAPIAAAIARGAFPHEKLEQVSKLDVLLPPDALPQVIYVDHYGNCFTGIPATALRPEAVIGWRASHIPYARTFSEAGPGRPFWYENSIGLAEVAVNRGSAAELLGLKVGAKLRIL